MKLFLLLALAFPVLSSSQLTIDLGSGAINNSPSTESSEAEYAYDFRAKDYFATRYDGSYVAPNWPDQVTLEPVEMSLEDFKRRLIGKWQIMFTCSGVPLSYREIISIGRNYLDGYLKSSAIFEYNTPNQMNRYKSTPISEVNEGAESVETFDRSSSTSWTALNSTDFKVTHSSFGPAVHRFIQIQETGELLLIAMHTNGRVCPNGEPLQQIFVDIKVIPLS